MREARFVFVVDDGDGTGAEAKISEINDSYGREKLIQLFPEGYSHATLQVKWLLKYMLRHRDCREIIVIATASEDLVAYACQMVLAGLVDPWQVEVVYRKGREWNEAGVNALGELTGLKYWPYGYFSWGANNDPKSLAQKLGLL